MARTTLHSADGFGDRLAEERERRGWTQQEMADEIGVTRVYVSFMETGARVPGLERFAQVCKTLDVRPDYMLAWSKRRK